MLFFVRLGSRLTVGRLTLDQVVGVRIPAPQPGEKPETTGKRNGRRDEPVGRFAFLVTFWSRPEKGCSEVVGGLLLHVGEDVAVGVERDLDAAVAQPVGHHLGVLPQAEHDSRVRVPQIVEPDARDPGSRA